MLAVGWPGMAVPGRELARRIERRRLAGRGRESPYRALPGYAPGRRAEPGRVAGASVVAAGRPSRRWHPVAGPEHGRLAIWRCARAVASGRLVTGSVASPAAGRVVSMVLAPVAHAASVSPSELALALSRVLGRQGRRPARPGEPGPGAAARFGFALTAGAGGRYSSTRVHVHCHVRVPAGHASYGRCCGYQGQGGSFPGPRQDSGLTPEGL